MIISSFYSKPPLNWSPFHKDLSSNSSTTPPGRQKWRLFQLSLPFSPHCILRLRERCERNVAVYQKTGARPGEILCHPVSRKVTRRRQFFVYLKWFFLLLVFRLIYVYWFKAITDEWLREVDNKRNQHSQSFFELTFVPQQPQTKPFVHSAVHCTGLCRRFHGLKSATVFCL